MIQQEDRDKVSSRLYDILIEIKKPKEEKRPDSSRIYDMLMDIKKSKGSPEQKLEQGFTPETKSKWGWSMDPWGARDIKLPEKARAEKKIGPGVAAILTDITNVTKQLYSPEAYSRQIEATSELLNPLMKTVFERSGAQLPPGLTRAALSLFPYFQMKKARIGVASQYLPKIESFIEKYGPQEADAQIEQAIKEGKFKPTPEMVASYSRAMAGELAKLGKPEEAQKLLDAALDVEDRQFREGHNDYLIEKRRAESKPPEIKKEKPGWIKDLEYAFPIIGPYITKPLDALNALSYLAYEFQNEATLGLGGAILRKIGGVSKEELARKIQATRESDPLLAAAGAGAKFAGFLTGPVKLSKGLNTFIGRFAKSGLGKALKKIPIGELAKSPTGARLIDIGRRINNSPHIKLALTELKGMHELGTAIALTELKNPSEMPSAYTNGVLMGAIFQGTKYINYFKSPVFNKVLRQVGSRGLLSLANQYQFNLDKWGKMTQEQKAQTLFDEILITYFGLKGGTVGEEVDRMRDAIAYGKTGQMIEKILEATEPKVTKQPRKASYVYNLNKMIDALPSILREPTRNMVFGEGAAELKGKRDYESHLRALGEQEKAELDRLRRTTGLRISPKELSGKTVDELMKEYIIPQEAKKAEAPSVEDILKERVLPEERGKPTAQEQIEDIIKKRVAPEEKRIVKPEVPVTEEARKFEKELTDIEKTLPKREPTEKEKAAVEAGLKVPGEEPEPRREMTAEELVMWRKLYKAGWEKPEPSEPQTFGEHKESIHEKMATGWQEGAKTIDLTQPGVRAVLEKGLNMKLEPGISFSRKTSEIELERGLMPIEGGKAVEYKERPTLKKGGLYRYDFRVSEDGDFLNIRRTPREPSFKYRPAPEPKEPPETFEKEKEKYQRRLGIIQDAKREIEEQIKDLRDERATEMAMTHRGSEKAQEMSNLRILEIDKKIKEKESQIVESLEIERAATEEFSKHLPADINEIVTRWQETGVVSDPEIKRLREVGLVEELDPIEAPDVYNTMWADLKQTVYSAETDAYMESRKPIQGEQPEYQKEPQYEKEITDPWTGEKIKVGAYEPSKPRKGEGEVENPEIVYLEYAGEMVPVGNYTKSNAAKIEKYAKEAGLDVLREEVPSDRLEFEQLTSSEMKELVAEYASSKYDMRTPSQISEEKRLMSKLPREREPWEKQYKDFVEGDRKEHRRVIKEAILQGKKIPHEVLREYPDLYKEYSRQQQKAVSKEAGKERREQEEENAKAGLSIKKIKDINKEAQKEVDNKKEDEFFELSNKEAEEKFQKNRQTNRDEYKKSILSTIKEGLEGWGRTFKELPETPRFHKAKQLFLQLEGAYQKVTEKVGRELDNILVEIKDSTQKMDLFQKMMFFADAKEMKDIGATRFFLGKGKNGKPLYTPSEIEAEYHRLLSIAKNYPEVMRTWDRRTRIWESVRSEFRKEAEELGIDVSFMARGDYMRNVILEFMTPAGREKLSQAGVLHYVSLNPINRLAFDISRLKRPGYAKARKKEYGGEGIEFNVLTDYPKAEWNILTKLRYDTEIMRVLNEIKKHEDVFPKVKEEFKKKFPGVDLSTREGKLALGKFYSKHPEYGHGKYVEFSPESLENYFSVTTIPEKLAKEVREKGISEISVEDLHNLLGLGAKRRWLIPREIAETFRGLAEESQVPYQSHVYWSRRALNTWKWWMLLSPYRVFKYNLRNLSGDLDPVLAFNPRVLLPSKLWSATKDLYNYYKQRGGESELLWDYFERGGINATLQAQEMEGLERGGMEKYYREMKELAGESTTKEKLLSLPRAYKQKVTMYTNLRENILRFANFTEYYNQLVDSYNKKKGTGTPYPRNWGCSNRRNILALYDPSNPKESMKDMAFELSNDLIGDYMGISRFGQTLRRHFYPFWSFQEANFKRYARGIRNEILDTRDAMKKGNESFQALSGVSKGLRIPAVMALHLGRIYIAARGMRHLTGFWNDTVGPKVAHLFGIRWDDDLQDKLPKEIKDRPYILFGQKDNGDPIYFPWMGAASELGEWVGIGRWDEWLDQLKRRDLGPFGFPKNMAKEFADHVFQGMHPAPKALGEWIVGQALYPSIWESRPIRDMGYHFSDLAAVGPLYKAIFSKKAIQESWHNADRSMRDEQLDTVKQLIGVAKQLGYDTQSAFAYTRNADDVNSIKANNAIMDYLHAHNITPIRKMSAIRSGKALYYFKLAQKMNDYASEVYYLKKYMDAQVGKIGSFIAGNATKKEFYENENLYKRKFLEELSKNISASINQLNPLQSIPDAIPLVGPEGKVGMFDVMDKEDVENIKSSVDNFIDDWSAIYPLSINKQRIKQAFSRSEGKEMFAYELKRELTITPEAILSRFIGPDGEYRDKEWGKRFDETWSEVKKWAEKVYWQESYERKRRERENK